MRISRFLRRSLPAAVAAACLAVPLVAGASGDDAALQAQLRQMLERIERLEQQNAALREQLGKAAAPAVEQRLAQVETSQKRIEQSLSTDRISENEPELVTRLKAVEFQTLSMQKQARQIGALEGISVSASLTGVVQSVNQESLAAPAAGGNRTNYRGDIALTLPGGEMGNAEGRIFVHTRFGQGDGLALRPTYTSTPNTTAFRVVSGKPDDAPPIVAQAWYQLSVPLPLDGIKRNSRETARLTFGKIDPFVFFDQNSIADDETVRFMNNAFVHNPLLDSGGDAGLDQYGFTPGVVAAYENVRNKAALWGASLGVFGSGRAASFDGSLAKPLVIAQFNTTQRIAGHPGNYRFYAWRNGNGEDFDGTKARHSGVGFSIDQRLTDTLTLFSRYGHQLSGRVRFDRAFTVGAELNGSSWGRGADGLGLAAGLLRTSSAFRADSATVDADGDGTPDYGYAATGWERVAELYYRFRVNSNFELTPDLQLIQRPGADGAAPRVKFFALRARVGF